MTAITLRNLSPNLYQRIRQCARQKRVSMNKAVIALIEEHLGLEHKKTAAELHDLAALCGRWTMEEAAAFDRALAEQRTIDPDLLR